MLRRHRLFGLLRPADFLFDRYHFWYRVEKDGQAYGLIYLTLGRKDVVNLLLVLWSVGVVLDLVVPFELEYVFGQTPIIHTGVHLARVLFS